MQCILFYMKFYNLIEEIYYLDKIEWKKSKNKLSFLTKSLKQNRQNINS